MLVVLLRVSSGLAQTQPPSAPGLKIVVLEGAGAIFASTTRRIRLLNGSVGQFLLVLPFTVQGSQNSIASVTVQLQNDLSAAPATANF